MTYHCFAPGGNPPRPSAAITAIMYPQHDVRIDQSFKADARKTTSRAAAMRFAAKDIGHLQLYAPPMREPNMPMASYVKEHPIVQGDTISAIILPKLYQLHWVLLDIHEPLPGVKMTVGIRGRAQSLGGGPTIAPEAINIPIWEGIEPNMPVKVDPKTCDMWSQTWFASDPQLHALNGGKPIYMDQNDMINIRFDVIPPGKDITCLQFTITAGMEELCTGSL